MCGMASATRWKSGSLSGRTGVVTRPGPFDVRADAEVVVIRGHSWLGVPGWPDVVPAVVGHLARVFQIVGRPRDGSGARRRHAHRNSGPGIRAAFKRRAR